MPEKSDVVCVVEDDAAVRNALKFSLESEGWRVKAFDGAFSLLESHDLLSCRCLIIDYRMPVMDGLELTAALRERGLAAAIIMITGRATRDLHARADRLGIRCVLEKPLADTSLVDAVRAIGKNRRRAS